MLSQHFSRQCLDRHSQWQCYLGLACGKFNVIDHEIPFYVMDRNYSQLWPNEVKGDVLDPVCFSYDTAEISPYCPSSSFDVVNAWVSAFQNEWLAPSICVQIQNTAANQGDVMIRYLASESDNMYTGHTKTSTIMTRDAKNLGNYYTAFETWSLEGASRTINHPIFKPYLNESLIFQKPVVESECAVIFSDQHVAEVKFPHTSLSSPPLNPDDNQHWMVPLNFTASNFDFSHGNIPTFNETLLSQNISQNISDSFLFQWIDLTNYAKVPLLGALSAFPFSNGLNISLAIMSCSFDAQWLPVSLSLDPTK